MSRNLLQIKASLFGEQGQSSQLSDAFVARWREQHPTGKVVVRDLAREPLPHLDGATFSGFLAAPAARTAAQQAAAELSETLIAELKAADLVVIGAPTYNLGVPSTLKAYFDYVTRAGLTFRYTAQGPQGLLSGQPVQVFATRGGRYAGTAADTVTEYLQAILPFIGLAAPQFVYAEGLAMGDAPRTEALAGAQAALAAIAL